jgi:hypothetical protein
VDTVADRVEIDSDKLAAVIVQLQRVGLRSADRLTSYLLSSDSFYEDTAEWSEFLPRVRFVFSKSAYTNVIRNVYVSEFIQGKSEYSFELIADVNSQLAYIFSEIFTSDLALEEVAVEYVNYGAQVARIRRADGSGLAINLWELEGRTRRADGYSNPRFRDSGLI